MIYKIKAYMNHNDVTLGSFNNINDRLNHAFMFSVDRIKEHFGKDNIIDITPNEKTIFITGNNLPELTSFEYLIKKSFSGQSKFLYPEFKHIDIEILT